MPFKRLRGLLSRHPASRIPRIPSLIRFDGSIRVTPLPCAMIFISLQSGSNGNCFYVETETTRLLFDAGISARQAAHRLASTGREIKAVDALFISHDHSDHTRAMGTYHRKFDVPVYATERTLNAIHRRSRQGTLRQVHTFQSGETVRFGGLNIESICTPHDGVDGVAFIIDDGLCRLGIFTDLGHVFAGLVDNLATLDAVVIESNYDSQMLEDGPYPFDLKKRIRGPGGHISNRESAELLSQLNLDSLQWACLAHLSEKNNHPQVALRTHRKILGEALPLYVADREQQSECMKILPSVFKIKK